jgi:hypothetical protein
MTDDVNFDLVDDPTPPEPDAAVLARVVDRGRQRLFRRRVIRGAFALPIAVALVGGGIAVAQRDASSPHIAVQPPTATTVDPNAPVTEREGDANGLHYTLTLVTPQVAVFGEVRVTLKIENHTDGSKLLGACELGNVVVYRPAEPRPAPAPVPSGCGSSAVVIAAGATRTYESRRLEAPAVPGDYLVSTDPAPAGGRSAPLLEPLDLRVTSAASPTSMTTTTVPGP